MEFGPLRAMLLKKDIKISMDAGFNGARLHQKVFEPRFLYHADKMGYIVWGEYSNWGMDHNDEAAKLPAMNEWIEIVERDYNHPSIVGWCPYNETPREASEIQNATVRLTKVLDPTRPVLDTSGWYHSTAPDLFLTRAGGITAREKRIFMIFTITIRIPKHSKKDGINILLKNQIILMMKNGRKINLSS